MNTNNVINKELKNLYESLNQMNMDLETPIVQPKTNYELKQIIEKAIKVHGNLYVC